MAQLAFIFPRNQEIQDYRCFKANVSMILQGFPLGHKMAAKVPAIMLMINAGRSDKRIPFYEDSENVPEAPPSRHSLCLVDPSWFTDHPLCGALRENGEQDGHNWLTTVWD